MKDALEALSRVPLFAHLNEGELAHLVTATSRVRFNENQVVFSAADPGDVMYVLLSGEAKVVLAGPKGREAILAILRGGDFFGEMALLDNQPRSANVIAMRNSEALELRRKEFQRCLRVMPTIALALLRELSRRLRRADSTIGGLALRKVEARLAAQLLAMADQDDRIDLPARRILAQFIGATRETVSRALGDLVQRGLIKVTGTTLHIADRLALKAAAGQPARPARGS